MKSVFPRYDNNGNLFKKQAKAGFPNSDVTNFSYSSENQLMGIQVFAGGVSQPTKEIFYTYDALGRRIQKRVIDHSAPNDPIKSFTRRYVYDGQEILLEYDGSNNLLARYTHSTLATDDVLSVNVTSSGVSAGLAQASGSYQYLKDGQGTITEVASNSGSKIQRYLYSAFGILLGIQDANAADITANPILNTSYGFTGRERDSESGYMYYRARYFDTTTGRFLQKDPYPGRLSLVMSVVNSYSYSANNPVNLSDPSGKFFFLIPVAIFIGKALVATIVAAAIAGTLAGIVNGIVSRANGGSFWDAFGSGFLAGAKSGAILGATAFGLGALGAAAGLSANAAQIFTGIVMGGYGAYQGAQNGGGLAGGLLGFVGGFVGGVVGSGAGYNAYNALTAASTAEMFQMQGLYRQLRSGFDRALEGPTFDPTYIPNMSDFNQPKVLNGLPN